MEKYWFKAELRFLCLSCMLESVERIVISDTRHDPTAVKQVIEDRVKPILCQWCKAICPDGTGIFLRMDDLTPEELSKLRLAAAHRGA
jgi:hypothetical protein